MAETLILLIQSTVNFSVDCLFERFSFIAKVFVVDFQRYKLSFAFLCLATGYSNSSLLVLYLTYNWSLNRISLEGGTDGVELVDVNKMSQSCFCYFIHAKYL